MSPNNYGRTLIELISALAILSILITTALPNLQNLLENNARAQAVNQMLAALHHARSDAVFSHSIVTLCAGQSECSGSQQWRGDIMVFRNQDANGQMDAGDELIHQARIAPEFSWKWNRANGHIQFKPDGATRALNGTLTLCKDGVAQHQIVVNLAGRVRTQSPRRGASC
ncbi:GspH/FimT family pseudopilin [Pseudomonas mendocina]|nr:GspH/FimT family pseudopilin [Pseudomonas mendocina]MBH3340062.1 GspH/FimT family pseudopilin [Pseudomonas mendocina]